VRFIHVPTELVSLWFDDPYHPATAEDVAAFSAKERAADAAFNRAFDDALKEIGQPLPEWVSCRKRRRGCGCRAQPGAR
jgi:hypothetical protein